MIFQFKIKCTTFGFALFLLVSFVASQNIEEGIILTPDSGVLSSKFNKNTRECKPIIECKSFLWLLQNNRTQKVLQDLVARDCGFRGTSQLIWCPAEQNITPSLLIPDEEERGGGVLTSLIRSKAACEGSLTIMHYGDSDSDFRRTRMAGKNYQNLKILRKRIVVKIETEGNCCWELHSESGFRGQVQEAEPGYSDSPDVQPKSIRRVSC